MSVNNKLIVANWKMHKSYVEGLILANSVISGLEKFTGPVDVVLCPPFIHLQTVSSMSKDFLRLHSGAQNCHQFEEGPYTGEISAKMIKSVGADYVIIGSGSAGSAMAYRLTEDGKHSVLVLEFGGTDAGPFIQMPAALSYPMNMRRYDWGFQSEPEAHLGGRRLATPRGKVIGGSSSINGMVYVRGHARDFDHWAEMGADGWAYADVLPYFKRMEHWHDSGHGGDPEWRGKSGPLHVSRGPRLNPLYQAFVDAGAQAGFERTDDYNGQQQEGFGPMEQTVWQGRRWSAANAYLRPAQKTGNVEIIRALAQREQQARAAAAVRAGSAAAPLVRGGGAARGKLCAAGADRRWCQLNGRS